MATHRPISGRSTGIMLAIGAVLYAVVVIVSIETAYGGDMPPIDRCETVASFAGIAAKSRAEGVPYAAFSTAFNTFAVERNMDGSTHLFLSILISIVYASEHSEESAYASAHAGCKSGFEEGT